jgi:hypothetical protein
MFGHVMSGEWKPCKLTHTLSMVCITVLQFILARQSSAVGRESGQKASKQQARRGEELWHFDDLKGTRSGVSYLRWMRPTMHWWSGRIDSGRQ